MARWMSCLSRWGCDFVNAEATRIKKRWKRIAVMLATVLSINVVGAAYLIGWFMDFEYVYWPTIWQASRAETSTGVRVADLIRSRATNPEVKPRWHHCGWCETAYAHAKHVAIKVTIDANEAFLFDWDAGSRRLLPITVRTAERFPELIPAGFTLAPLSNPSLDGQLHCDRACQVVAKPNEI